MGGQFGQTSHQQLDHGDGTWAYSLIPKTGRAQYRTSDIRMQYRHDTHGATAALKTDIVVSC